MAASIPVKLVAALQSAHHALEQDSTGALLRGQRELIWATFDDAAGLGKRRRTELAIAATREVLADWHRAFADQDLPDALLALARRVLNGSANLADAARTRGDSWTKMENLMSSGPHAELAVVGLAAAQALSAALFDETFDPTAPRHERSDADVDPETHDASYLASVARSGGPPWAKGTSVAKRRAYWHWWLDKAVPDAYRGEAMVIEPLLAIVARADAEEIESARDRVSIEHLPALASAYTTLTWPQRRALVMLIQDHPAQTTRALMEDFLRHSPAPIDIEQEPYQVARAIALCHLQGSLDRFEHYLEHPEEVDRRRAT
jgi:hypothetical protein